MNKKEIIEKLKEMGVEFDGRAAIGELENILNATIKERMKKIETTSGSLVDIQPEISEVMEEIPGPPLKKGWKRIKVTHKQMMQLQEDGLLCSWDPKNNIAKIKG